MLRNLMLIRMKTTGPDSEIRPKKRINWGLAEYIPAVIRKAVATLALVSQLHFCAVFHEFGNIFFLRFSAFGTGNRHLLI